jgi:hypothetical protein
MEYDRETLLDHLERRRSGLEQAQWQAPALTVAAQAFLLPVLTNQSISGAARAVILAAGFAAVIAAVMSLWRLRSREVMFSEVFAHYSEQLMPDIRAGSELPRKPPAGRTARRFDKLDKRVQKWCDGFGPPYLAWSFALMLFGIADLVAYLITV